jgi:hypothetical protein
MGGNRESGFGIRDSEITMRKLAGRRPIPASRFPNPAVGLYGCAVWKNLNLPSLIWITTALLIGSPVPLNCMLPVTPS